MFISLGVSGKILDKCMKIFYIVLIVFLLNTVRTLFSGDLEGDFVLFERDPKSGHMDIFRFRARRQAPKLTLNMLGIHVDSELNKSVSYHRRVGGLFGFEFYVGGNYGQDKIGRPFYGIGIQIGF